MAGKVKQPKTSIKIRDDRHNTEAATVLKIQDAAKMLSKGKSRATVMQHLMKTYELTERTARDYYLEAVRFLLPEDEGEFKQSLIKSNVSRLETIAERCMEEGDWKNAKEAISELNKMCGITGSGFQIGVKTDKETDTQQIIIKFDS